MIDFALLVGNIRFAELELISYLTEQQQPDNKFLAKEILCHLYQAEKYFQLLMEVQQRCDAQQQ